MTVRTFPPAWEARRACAGDRRDAAALLANSRRPRRDALVAARLVGAREREGATVFCDHGRGEIAGCIQYCEEDDPDT